MVFGYRASGDDLRACSDVIVRSSSAADARHGKCRSLACMSEWPSHLLASGVLVWDESGQLLLVQTHNRSSLILPGGLVEADESPAVAAHREVLEEVGLDVSIGRLLVVQYLDGEDERPSSVQFVFDSRPVPLTSALRLQVEEIASAHWLEPDEAVAAHGVRGRTRLIAALAARAGETVSFLDSTRTR